LDYLEEKVHKLYSFLVKKLRSESGTIIPGSDPTKSSGFELIRIHNTAVKYSNTAMIQPTLPLCDRLGLAYSGSAVDRDRFTGGIRSILLKTDPVPD
jgi:hypothetical protein